MQRRDLRQNGDLSRKVNNVVSGVSPDLQQPCPWKMEKVMVSKDVRFFKSSFEEAFCSYLCRIAEVNDGNETKG